MTNFLRKTITISVALLALAENIALAQDKMEPDDSKSFHAALKLADKSNNRAAIGILRSLYEKYPDNMGVAYNLGVCYINASGNPDSTLFFLNRVKQLDTNDSWDDARIELHLAIARAQQLCGRPQEALKIYDEVEKADSLKAYADIIRRERAICENAVVLTAKPVHLALKSMGKGVNSNENDYRPVLTAGEDTVYFTSRRPKKDADKKVIFDDGQYEEGVYFSVRQGNKWDGANWGDAKPVRGLVRDENGKAGQETATSISSDGRELYVCHNGDIYVSHKDEKTNEWLPATPLPEPVNTVFNEDFAFITPDGQELYISSDCPGGFGGKDIYRSRRLPNGQWGEPLNLGPGVNTEEDEDAPFFHEPTGILYFSSRGHNTMGGYDIFFAPQNDKGEYEVATNIGYPINSPDDDLFFSPSTDRDRAFYASIRWNDESEAPSYNLYEAEFDQPEQNRMAVVAAVVKADNLEDVSVVTLQNGEIIGIGRPNVNSGRFITIVEAGGDYDIRAYCGADSLSRHVATLKSQSYYASHAPVEIEPFEFSHNGNVSKQHDISAEPQKNDADDRQSGKPDDDRPYTVQLMSLRAPLDMDRLSPALDSSLVSEYRYRDGWFVYSYGAYETFREAFNAQKEIRRDTRYDDAFARNSKQYSRFVIKSESADTSRKNLTGNAVEQ